MPLHASLSHSVTLCHTQTSVDMWDIVRPYRPNSQANSQGRHRERESTCVNCHRSTNIAHCCMGSSTEKVHQHTHAHTHTHTQKKHNINNIFIVCYIVFSHTYIYIYYVCMYIYNIYIYNIYIYNIYIVTYIWNVCACALVCGHEVVI